MSSSVARESETLSRVTATQYRPPTWRKQLEREDTIQSQQVATDGILKG